MAGMTFNQFQQELTRRNIEPQTAYMLAVIYEQMVEMGQQQEEMAKLMVTFAEGVAKVISMHQSDQQTLGKIAKRVGEYGKTPGVDVSSSVVDDPSDKG